MVAVVVGLDDLSVEEVRLNAYEAKANGNLNAYVSMLYLHNFCPWAILFGCFNVLHGKLY